MNIFIVLIFFQKSCCRRVKLLFFKADIVFLGELFVFVTPRGVSFGFLNPRQSVCWVDTARMSHAPASGSDGFGVSVCDAGKTFFGCGLVACLAQCDQAEPVCAVYAPRSPAVRYWCSGCVRGVGAAPVMADTSPAPVQDLGVARFMDVSHCLTDRSAAPE